MINDILAPLKVNWPDGWIDVALQQLYDYHADDVESPEVEALEAWVREMVMAGVEARNAFRQAGLEVRE